MTTPISIPVLSDPGNAWALVPAGFVVALGITARISPYSYVHPREDLVALEEDCDLSVLLDALCKRLGCERGDVEFVARSTDDDASVRNWPGFTASRCRAAARNTSIDALRG